MDTNKFMLKFKSSTVILNPGKSVLRPLIAIGDPADNFKTTDFFKETWVLEGFSKFSVNVFNWQKFKTFLVRNSR